MFNSATGPVQVRLSLTKAAGEQYFDAPVYKHLEAIAQQRERIERIISFPLTEFDVAIS